VSPHLDDAVISLGASIYRATRAGSYVRIVTVFSGDPDSVLEASGWDSLPGFSTEGQAVRMRRSEDADACSAVGADRAYLPFSEPIYAGPPNVEAVLAAVRDAVRDIDTVLVPGFPLIHRDHRWVTEHVLGAGLDDVKVGLYVEQPYRHTKARLRRVTLAAELRQLLADEPQWKGARSSVDEIRAKRRAVSAYRSQLPWLELDGTRLARMLLSEAIRGGEALAWVKPVSLSLGARSSATTP
jgi:LmbE family N-acetylglucosaminyl deacetylase